MNPVFWQAAAAFLAAAAAALLVKLRLLRKSMDEMDEQMEEILCADTNNLLTVSSRDPHVRRLAAGLNRHLLALRRLQLRCQTGDRELRAAYTNISHDLRTPLTAICGYLDLLEREDVSEDAARYLAYIGERTRAMKKLTEELFRYSVAHAQETGLKREPVCLNAALEESAAAFYGALTEKGIEPVIRMTARRIERSLDRTALARILGNVLHNALKYSDGDLEIELTETGEILVENGASRLDEVQVGRLFDRYFTVETARDSTGLGLSIARSLTEQMGGTISAACAQGRLTIRICFPQPARGEIV